METLKSQFEERVELDLDEKQSLRQRLKELEGGLCNLKEL